MCGIVGWLSTQAAHPVDGETLGRMRDTMVHRGPDGAGLCISPGREVGLAHRRLAIIDLSAAAPADGQRGRHGLGGLQRRDLQPPGAARGAGGGRATGSAPTTPTPR